MITDEQRLSESEFQQVAQQVDVLVQEFEALPFPELRAKAIALLEAIDTLHRESLGRLVGHLRQHGAAELVERAADDVVVRTLLTIYDLLPSDERAQVETALSEIRPYIHSHGGELEVLDVVDGVVHVRLGGACQGCAGSAMTLRRGVETALREHLPGFKRMQVHEAPASPSGQQSSFIPLAQLGTRQQQLASRGPLFVAVGPVDELTPGSMRLYDLQNVHVLVANLDGEIYAVRNQCPGSMAPLHLGTFTPPVVVCPWHNEAYDLRTGKRVDGVQGSALTPIPVAVLGGQIQLAVNLLADRPTGAL